MRIQTQPISMVLNLFFSLRLTAPNLSPVSCFSYCVHTGTHPHAGICSLSFNEIELHQCDPLLQSCSGLICKRSYQQNCRASDSSMLGGYAILAMRTNELGPSWTLDVKDIFVCGKRFQGEHLFIWEIFTRVNVQMEYVISRYCYYYHFNSVVGCLHSNK